MRDAQKAFRNTCYWYRAAEQRADNVCEEKNYKIYDRTNTMNIRVLRFYAWRRTNLSFYLRRTLLMSLGPGKGLRGWRLASSLVSVYNPPTFPTMSSRKGQVVGKACRRFGHWAGVLAMVYYPL